MMKSFKIMLVPNNRQRTRLFQFAGTARFAYNWALRKEIDAYEAGEKFISNFDLRKEFTVLRNSAEYSWLRTISNNVTKQAIKDCVDAYQKFFKRQSGRPKFKSKRRGDFSFYQDTDKIQITATHVKLEAIATSKKRNKQQLNWIRLAEVGRIPVGVKYKQPRITFDGLNWWLSVAVEFADPKPAENCNEALGIDLGIKNLAVCSDGTIYPNINRTSTIRSLKKKQRRLQRSISRKYEMNNKKGESYSKTRNIIKSEKKLLRVHHRLADIRQNYRHQITSAIIGRKPNPIVLEDLNVRGMMSNRHLAKAVQEQGFYEFRRQIEYKAAWSGLRVVIADRFYPSSKKCIACGHVKKNLRLSERIYHCENCGNEIDRDLQAAINLKRYAS
ncbi:MAG: transposase [Selenomonadaceae bacterium]|nr:transposase [Selenomonadaceae bacterium]